MEVFFCLFNVLISVTTAFSQTLMQCAKQTTLSLMDILGKEEMRVEMRVKRQML